MGDILQLLAILTVAGQQSAEQLFGVFFKGFWMRSEVGPLPPLVDTVTVPNLAKPPSGRRAEQTRPEEGRCLVSEHG